MSYILDALKRAEAERLGSTVAHPALPSAFAVPPPRRTLPRALLFAAPLAAGAILGAVLVGGLRTGAEPVAPTPPAAAVNAGTDAVLAEAQAAPVQASILPPPADPTPVVGAAVPAPPPVKPAVKSKPATPPAEKSAAPEPAPAELGTLRDLPDHIQREIPPLVIGGYLYSSVAADRTVLIDKRLRREGDEVAPGLRIESLQPNGMVLNYRGHRYRSTY